MDLLGQVALREPLVLQVTLVTQDHQEMPEQVATLEQAEQAELVAPEEQAVPVLICVQTRLLLGLMVVEPVELAAI